MYIVGNLRSATRLLFTLLLILSLPRLGQKQPKSSSPARNSHQQFSLAASIRNSQSTDSTVLVQQDSGNIAFADEFPGGDCGAKINAASRALAGPGEIWVSKNCGLTISTQPTNQTHSPQTIRFVQDSTWNCSVEVSAADCFNGDGTNGGWTIIGRSRLGTIIKITTPTLNGWGMNCGARAEHVTFDGSGVGSMGIHSGGSKARHCANNFINDVRCQNWQIHGLNAGGYPDDWIVIKSWFLNNRNDGVYIGANGLGNLVVGNHASRNGGNGIDLGGCSKCVATGNEVLGNGTLAGGCVMDRVGILLAADSTDIGPVNSTIVTRNTATGNYAGGIFLHAADGATVSANLIAENSVENNNKSGCPPRGGGGIEVLYNQGRRMTVTNNLIAHNTINNNTGYGVYWGTSGSVAPIASGNIVANNAWKNNSMGNFVTDNYAHVTNTSRR